MYCCYGKNTRIFIPEKTIFNLSEILQKLKTLKKLAFPLRRTPFHPQWFGYRHNRDINTSITKYSSGIVLDIGCGSGDQKKYLRHGCIYYGLDLPFTSINWYETKPDIYASADTLPVNGGSVSTALLFDVMEHLTAPEKCLAEIYRVLSPDGLLIIKIPFLYPIHDAPLDFTRWTEHGLIRLFDSYNFKIIEAGKIGHPMETAALLLCIAISKHTLNWFADRSVFLLIGILLCPMIPFINLGAWILSKISRNDPMMPQTYHYVLKKKV